MVGLVAATIEDAGAADCSPSSRKKERERERLKFQQELKFETLK